MSARCLHHLNLIVLSGFNHESFKNKMMTTCDLVMQHWSPNLHLYSSRLVTAMIDMSQRVFREFRPTPLKAHYCFSWRDLTKIMTALQMVDSFTMKN